MNWYAYTAMYPVKAAHELREAQYEAFALMRLDRRRQTRHVKAKGSQVLKPIVAVPGYVFVRDPSMWALSRMKHVGQPIRFCGRPSALPPQAVQWIIGPHKELFRDDQPPASINRPAPPVVKPGDAITTTLASEHIRGEVVSVSQDGHTLMMRLQRAFFGRDEIRVPVSMVNVAA